MNLSYIAINDEVIHLIQLLDDKAKNGRQESSGGRAMRWQK